MWEQTRENNCFHFFVFIPLQLEEQAEDPQVQRYCYYYLARILAESGADGGIPGGGIPTPNWDALAEVNVAGGVTRADVVPLILSKLSIEAANVDNAGKFTPLSLSSRLTLQFGFSRCAT